MGDDEFLNRMHEFLTTRFTQSKARVLLKAEFETLAVLARRLNEMASKGVHAVVTLAEAKQGLLGLYLFSFNVISHLNESTEENDAI